MWSLLLMSLLAVPPIFEVQTLGADRLAGPIIGLGHGRVTVGTSEGPVSLETAKVMAIYRPGEPDDPQVARGVRVDLVDGTRLVAAGYSVREGRARIAMAGGRTVEVPARDVAAVRLQPQTDAISSEWSRVLAMDVAGDLLVVRTGDSLDYHQGTLRDVTDEVVRFELDGELLPVKRTKVYGLIYYQSAGRNLPDPVCRIHGADGSRWPAQSLAMEGESLGWTTPLGVEAARPLAQVARIDFSEGKVLYLSDLEPESLVWTPYFGTAEDLPGLARWLAPRQDRSLEGGPLELGGKPYQKGLAVHSRTSLVYRLPGPFRRFKAVAGIDDRVRPRGHVRLVIRGDGRVLLDTAVAGTDPPRTVDLDVSGVRRLAILADFGEDLDVADHLDLCEARIVK